MQTNDKTLFLCQYDTNMKWKCFDCLLCQLNQLRWNLSELAEFIPFRIVFLIKNALRWTKVVYSNVFVCLNSKPRKSTNDIFGLISHDDWLEEGICALNVRTSKIESMNSIGKKIVLYVSIVSLWIMSNVAMHLKIEQQIVIRWHPHHTYGLWIFVYRTIIV